jgi:hypothetical protein
MAGRPGKQLTPQEQEARQEGIARRKAKRELERADRAAQRQLREEALARRRAMFAQPGNPDPLVVYREGLELARRAGMTWYEAKHAAYEAALSVIPRAEDIDVRLHPSRIARCRGAERVRREAERTNIEEERTDWADALYDTQTEWMRAYERRPTGCSL